MLPVPVEHYDEIVARLAELRAGQKEPAVVTQSGPESKERPRREWTNVEVARLKRTTKNAFLITAMDMLSERGAGIPVSFTEITKRTGLTHSQVRALAGGTTKAVRHYFDRSNWPFDVDYSVDSPAQYVCHEQRILDWWKAA